MHETSDEKVLGSIFSSATCLLVYLLASLISIEWKNKKFCQNYIFNEVPKVSIRKFGFSNLLLGQRIITLMIK